MISPKKRYTILLSLGLWAMFLWIHDPADAHSEGTSPKDGATQEKVDDNGPIVITIDISQDRKPISPYLYGVNIANWCAWYYLNQVTPLLTEANVEVVRLGATNMERYNYVNNRMYNVITRSNQYSPMSWESFVTWCKESVRATPFCQTSAYGHVAGEGESISDGDYDYVQSYSEVASWVGQAGRDVRFWGIGNEPWIAWKRGDYPGFFSDAAHGDQVLNDNTAYDYYFDRFANVALAIKQGNPEAHVFGPTPANWYLYWSNEYSPFCPVTSPNGPPLPSHPGWQVMMAPENEWNTDVYSDRGGNPDETGWETDIQRSVCQFLIRMKAREDQTGVRLVDYMDVHRYIRTISDHDAVQEPRGLWQDDFESWDMETLYSGIKTRVLKRLGNAVESYYPQTNLAFTEYGYFYWDGHPELSQISAIGMVDYIGFFARGGVGLACAWYAGEPNQSTEIFAHSVDSAKQAMFDEQGRPNPKYWAFYLMSHFFRGVVVSAEVSDWDIFSVHACQKENGDVVVIAVNKGEYEPDTGEFIAGRSPKQATVAGLPGNLLLNRILRFGQNDPSVVNMDISGSSFSSAGFTFDFEPLAIYAFEFTPNGAGSLEAENKNGPVNPERIDFGPYDTGVITDLDEPLYTKAIHITNQKTGGMNWRVDEDSPWLDAANNTSGQARVTDLVYLTADRTDLDLGLYSTTVTVKVPDGEYHVAATMEVIPGESGGEKRITDFETGSLAHTLNAAEPYAVGWWDGHGGPSDRNSPYIYRFFLDKDTVSRLGGIYCMKISFDRTNGDTESGRYSLTFGTYGHAGATEDWTGYESFQFDVKAETVDSAVTGIEVVITDGSGRKGKPVVGVDNHLDLMEITDGPWQTVVIPLDSDFYDWRYPEGQNGSKTEIDFSGIRQIEFSPWSGHDEKSGDLYLDNLRLVKPDSHGNHYPVAKAETIFFKIGAGETIRLNGLPSFDSDGEIRSYRWTPATHLSDPSMATPNFQTDSVGTYVYDLIVTDGRGVESRNPVQVQIEVTSEGQTGGFGFPEEDRGCFISTIE